MSFPTALLKTGCVEGRNVRSRSAGILRLPIDWISLHPPRW